MEQKNVDQIEQLEESLKEIRLSLKKNVSAVRTLEAQLRKLSNSLVRSDSPKERKVKTKSVATKQNKLQQELNSLPLQERQQFLERLKSGAEN
ncbi:MAG: hypothetical protein K9J17_00140 [Flavobacteriales bacterium]|nr:hypothetical protein [Flavobacteriales bacterium]